MIEPKQNEQNKDNQDVELLQSKWEPIKREASTVFSFEEKDIPSVSYFTVWFTWCSYPEVIMLLFGVLGALGGGVALQMIEYQTGKLINVFLSIDPASSPDLFMNEVIKVSIIQAIIGVGSWVGAFLMMTLTYYFGQRVGAKYKVEYFSMLIKQNQKFFDLAKINPFEFSNKVVQEWEGIQKGIGTSIGNFLFIWSSTVGSFIVALTVNWEIALILSILLPVVTILIIVLLTLLGSSMEQQNAKNETIGGQVEEVLYKIKTVCSFGNYDFEKRSFSSGWDYVYQLGKKRVVVYASFMAVMGGLFYFTIAIGLFYGSFQIYRDYVNEKANPLNAGDFYSVTSLISITLYQISEMIPNLRLFEETTTNAKFFFALRKYHLEKMKRKEKDPYQDNKPEIKKNELQFKNVTFAYPRNPEEKVFNDLSMIFPPGKVTAIIGESGCGKSTIVNLIERIYHPSNGEITLDEVPINNINIAYYRELIGYVSQEPVLFNDSIRNNIIFGRDGISTEDIEESIRRANIEQFVKEADKGLDYEVGVKGGKLSGGQKQRVAIARAIVKKPKILWFDEATSALDNKSERQVMKAINSIRHDVTMIIIAHRLNTIQNADHIIVLDKGKGIVEQGSPSEWLSKKGKYYEMMEQNKANAIHVDDKDNDDIDNQINLNSADDLMKESASKKETKNEDSNTKNAEKSELVNKEKDNNNQKEPSNYQKWTRILKGFKLLFYTGLLLSLLEGIVQPLAGTFYGGTITILGQPDKEKVKKEGTIYGAYFIGLFIGLYIISFFKSYAFELLGEKLIVYFKKEIFNTYLSMHMGYYDIKDNSPGTLVSQMTIKTSTINGVVWSIFGVLVQSIGSLVSSNIVGFIFDWKLTLINFVFIPIVILVNFGYSKLLAEDDAACLNTTYGSTLSESLSNTWTIYSFNAEKKMIELFKANVYENERIWLKGSLIRGIFHSIINAYLFFEYSIMFYVSGILIKDGKLTLDTFIKTFAAVIGGTFMVAYAVKYFNNIHYMFTAIDDLYSTINMSSEINPFETKNKDIITNERDVTIQYQNVTFAYPTNEELNILKDVTFEIKPGEKIGFIGESGSGKSTITQLLERFYDIKNGKILINDKSIQDYNVQSLRNVIGYVQQEPAWFARNVYENIKYGNLSASDEEIRNIAKKCKIDGKLEVEVSNDITDNRQALLSGGEKQRVAIARALLKKPKILLLDEATSALDAETEKSIQQMLDDISKEDGFSMIVIAHRLSTVENCQRCYKIDKGQIVGNGKLGDVLTLKVNK